MRFIFTFFLIMMFTASGAHAQDGSLNIAVVDVQQLMTQSKAAKSVQSQGQDLLKKYQKQIEGLEKDLKVSEEKLIEKSKGEDKDAFMKEREAFQKEVMEGRKEIQEMNNKKDQAVADALNKIREEILDIIGDMTEENNYDLVITRADVVTVSKDIDITADVMKILNKNLSSVKVKD